MKIQYSLKHTTEEPVNSLKGEQLVNDKIYFDLGLSEALALIVDGIVKWTWCKGDIQNEFNYLISDPSINEELFGARFAELPKGIVITFTQDYL